MAAPTDVSIEINATEGDAPLAVAVVPHATDPNAAVTPVVTIDWGDHTPVTVGDAESPVAHVYSSPGQYTITTYANIGADRTDADDTIITVAAPNAYPLLSNPGGVCVPWLTAEALCFNEPGTREQELAAQALNIATRWINDATGGRWAGPCTTLIRPYTGRDGGTGCHVPTGLSNLRGPIDLSLYLTTPILRIIEIRVDGEPVDDSWYYLSGTLLYASKGFNDGESPLLPWPPQDRERPPGAVDTWDALVEHGAGPPEPLVHAVKRLAEELVKQCCDYEECALPSNVSSISRDGVTMSFAPIGPGRCGIPAIDSVIAMYGPDGYGQAPPRMLDPAAHQSAQIHRFS